MSPRPYRIGRREAAVDATRQAIIEAARNVLIKGGYAELSLDRVAQAAGVARATVYYQFGSKDGLLEAVASDAERRAGIERFSRIMVAKTTSEAMGLVVGEHARFWAADQDLFRTLIGLGRIDPEFGKVVDRHDRGRRENVRQAVERLSAEGGLGRGWTVPLATDLLWFLTGFEAFDHLHRRSGMSVRSTASLLQSMARAILRDRL